MPLYPTARGTTAAVLLIVLAASSVLARPPAHRRQRLVPTQAVNPAEASIYPMLGTFYPTPYMVVRGNGPAGGGYSPLQQTGQSMLSIYGPISPLRSISAPVQLYTRGYDGVVRPQVGTSFSYPMQPRNGPIVYPTPANVYPGFRRSALPPEWQSSINWLDQN